MGASAPVGGSLGFLDDRLAVLGRAFSEASGIVPLPKDRGRWINDLNYLYDAGVSPEEVKQAVATQRAKGRVITAPGSIATTAKDEKAKRVAPPLPDARSLTLSKQYEDYKRGS